MTQDAEERHKLEPHKLRNEVRELRKEIEIF